MLTKFWTWYDNIEEPWRMIFAFSVLMMPMCISFVINNNIPMLLIIPIVVSRMYFKIKNL